MCVWEKWRMRGKIKIKKIKKDIHCAGVCDCLVDNISIVYIMDWNFGFYRWYFIDILNIGRPRNDFEYQLSNGRNFKKKSKILPKYLRYIDLELINQHLNQSWSDALSSVGERKKNCWLFRVFLKILKTPKFEFLTI